LFELVIYKFKAPWIRKALTYFLSIFCSFVNFTAARLLPVILLHVVLYVLITCKMREMWPKSHFCCIQDSFLRWKNNARKSWFPLWRIWHIIDLSCWVCQCLSLWNELLFSCSLLDLILESNKKCFYESSKVIIVSHGLKFAWIWLLGLEHVT
jgi:hypothetical protein